MPERVTDKPERDSVVEGSRSLSTYSPSELRKVIEMCNCPVEVARQVLKQEMNEAKKVDVPKKGARKSTIKFKSVAVRGRSADPRVPFILEVLGIGRADKAVSYPYLRKLRQQTRVQEEKIRIDEPKAN